MWTSSQVQDAPRGLERLTAVAARWLTLGSVLPVVVSVVLSGAACARNESSSTDKARPTKPLRIAWSYWLGYSPLVIADQQGFFQKHQLPLELVQYDVSAKQMPDFEAGLLDAGLFAYADALTLASRHPDAYRLILVCDNSAGADVVVAHKDIQTVAALKGKRIGAGVGSFGELLVRRMLDQNGLSIEDVQLVNMSAEVIPDALERGLIDAGQTWDPFAATAVAAGHHPLFTSAQTPGLIPDVLLVQSSVLAERAEELALLLRGWFDAVAFMRANPQEAIAIIARRTQKDPAAVSLGGVRIFDLQENLSAFTDADSSLSLARSAETNLRFMLSTGALTKEPALEALLDASVLQALSATRP